MLTLNILKQLLRLAIPSVADGCRLLVGPGRMKGKLLPGFCIVTFRLSHSLGKAAAFYRVILLMPPTYHSAGHKNSGDIDRVHRGLGARNQKQQDALDRVKACGVDERVDAVVELSDAHQGVGAKGVHREFSICVDEEQVDVGRCPRDGEQHAVVPDSYTGTCHDSYSQSSVFSTLMFRSASCKWEIGVRQMGSETFSSLFTAQNRCSESICTKHFDRRPSVRAVKVFLGVLAYDGEDQLPVFSTITIQLIFQVCGILHGHKAVVAWSVLWQSAWLRRKMFGDPLRFLDKMLGVRHA